jgi:hypothetical protein
MDRIPVGRTLGRSFGFAFGQYFGILGAVWLPIALLCACEYFALAPVIRAFPALLRAAVAHPHAGPPPEFAAANHHVMAFYPLILFLSVWSHVGVTKEALGRRDGLRFVYLPLTLDEWRALGGLILVMALFYGAVIAVVVAGVVVAGVAAALFAGGAIPTGLAHDPRVVAGFVGLALVMVAALLVVLIRLTFFLFPVTVAEKRFGVWRSWQLTHGNTGRVVLIGFLIFLTILVLELVFMALAGTAIVLTLGQSVDWNAADLPDHLPAVFERLALPFGIAFAVVTPVLYGLVTVHPPSPIGR